MSILKFALKCLCKSFIEKQLQINPFSEISFNLKKKKTYIKHRTNSLLYSRAGLFSKGTIIFGRPIFFRLHITCNAGRSLRTHITCQWTPTCQNVTSFCWFFYCYRWQITSVSFELSILLFTVHKLYSRNT